MEDLKTCSKCKEDKPLSSFYNCSAAKDGKMYRCKACRPPRAGETVNREKANIAQRKWYNANEKAAPRVYVTEDHIKARKRRNRADYYAAHRNEEIAQATKWAADNPSNVAEIHLRRKRVKDCVPSFAKTEFGKLVVREMYDLARRRTKSTGFKWHVDHRVPLVSRVVCGLHCADNLQVIPASVNQSKGNYYWEDMWQ